MFQKTTFTFNKKAHMAWSGIWSLLPEGFELVSTESNQLRAKWRVHGENVTLKLFLKFHRNCNVNNRPSKYKKNFHKVRFNNVVVSKSQN